MRGRIRTGALVLGCTVAFVAPGQASAALYMEADGLTGDSVVVGYEGAIELSSLQFGIGRTSATKGGPSFSEFTVSKQLDPATTTLMSRAATGTTISSARISLVRSTTEGPQLRLRYCLTGVRVTGFSSSSGGDEPSESISLSYATLITRNTVQDSSGGAGETFHFGWDLIRVIQFGADQAC